MKTTILNFFLLVIIINKCIAQNESSTTFEKFNILSEIPKTFSEFNKQILLKMDTISYSEIESLGLFPSNLIRYSNDFFPNYFYSYGKFKLDSNNYMLIIIQKYNLHGFRIIYGVLDVKTQLIKSDRKSVV